MNDEVKTEPAKSELIAKPRVIRPRSDAPIEDQMIHAGLSQNVPIADMERLYALRQRAIEDNAKRDYVAAMSAFRAEPIRIDKNKHVSFPGRDGGAAVDFHHAELSDVTEVVGPIMSKHGLSFRWNPRREGERVFVDTIIEHANGHRETVTLDGPLDASGKKNAIQQLGSTITYLQRYGLMAALGVAAKGQDNDGKDGKSEDIELSPEEKAEQDKIDSLYDKMKLSETIEELRKLKSEIATVKDAAKRRNLTGAWNTRAKEFKLAEAA